MGAEESTPIPPPPPSAYPDQRYSPYFMFSLYYDTLHLVYAPPEIANLVVNTVAQALGAGAIQYHKPKLQHGYKIVFHETLFRFACEGLVDFLTVFVSLPLAQVAISGPNLRTRKK